LRWFDGRRRGLAAKLILGGTEARASPRPKSERGAGHVRTLSGECLASTKLRGRRRHLYRRRLFPEPLSTHIMAMRHAVGRPLGAAVRSAGCPRVAVRTFAATALRAKEVAGESSETPNMRVSCHWHPFGTC